jgi:hypothetical protein
MSPERARRRRSRIKWGVIVFVTLLFITACGVITYFWVESNRTDALREAIIEGCEQSSLRKVAIEQQKEELQDPHDHRIRILFPNVSPKLAEEIIEEGNQEHLERIKKLSPGHCKDQYDK